VLGPDRNPLEIRVRLGLTDGNVTEVSGSDLREGAEVVVGTLAAGSAARAGGSPPRLPF
jgi:HlyD family secretion protein